MSEPPSRGHTQSTLRDLLAGRRLRARSSLGQCFLIDLNLLDILIDRAAVGPDDFVLEVGAGTGSLTRRLAARAGFVLSVEIDAGLFELAREATVECANVSIVRADILRNKNALQPAVLDAVAKRSARFARRKLVANLPYAVATPVIMLLLVGDTVWERFVVTIQKEVADRLVALPGTKDYGSLSVLVQALSDVETVRDLPPSAFWPRPRVASTIVAIVPNRDKRSSIRDLARFHRLVRGVLLHRRKNLRGALAAMFPDVEKTELDRYIASLSLDPRGRAETLAVNDFIRLADHLPFGISNR